MSVKTEDSRAAAARSREAAAERVAWPDERLVRECLNGNEEAWAALVDKYKNLIYSIPVKYRFSSDDAADIFQAVCLELLAELPKLRNAKALPKWIIQITSHKCSRHKRLYARVTPVGLEQELPDLPTPAEAEGLLQEAEEEQNIRQALLDLPPRCRRLIQMLFYEEPSRPYQTIAAELGLAPGSIGFIRQRCLDKLRKRLEEVGFS